MSEVKKINEPTLVLFDKEEEYSLLMYEYLKSQNGLPWKIRTYSQTDDLISNEKQNHISLLVVAESSYDERMKELDSDEIVVLNESGFEPENEIRQICKYQAAESVLHSLLEIYLEIAGDCRKILAGQGKTKFIGIYSPIKRSYQSSFALSMSEILSDSFRTLYISFEHYCGMQDIMPTDKETDLSDLVYFLNADSERFQLHFKTMIQKRGNLSYIPPMKSGQNLLSVTGTEWMNLIKRINESDLVDVVILDMTDSMQGLFEVLRSCDYIFTVMKEDRFAQVKMMHYEHLLKLYEFDDIMDKTIRFTMPKFQYIPDNLDQYTKGDFADYVKQMIRKMEDLKWTI